MGKWVHRILSVDEDSGSVDCANCGKVALTVKNGRVKCSIARREQKGENRNWERERRIAELGYEYTGSCEICGDIDDDPQVDHCHQGGQARGYLCRRCNLMLGYARDSIDTLYAAIGYLSTR